MPYLKVKHLTEAEKKRDEVAKSTLDTPRSKEAGILKQSKN